MKTLLAPAIGLINRLSYSRKFLLIGLVILLPLSVTLYFLLSGINREIEFTRKERMGIEYILELRKLLEDVPQHRGMTNAFLNGDTAFRERILEKRSQIAEDIRGVDRADGKLGTTLKTTGKWNAIKSQWQDLEGKAFRLPAKESFDAHTVLIADILSLITYVGETSGMIFDPHLDINYLLGSIISKLPPLIENIGQVRGIGAGVAARRSVTVEQKLQLATLAALTKSVVATAHDGLYAAFRENQALESQLQPYWDKTEEAIKVFLGMLNNRIIHAESINMDPKDYFAAGTRVIDRSFETYDKVAPVLDALLQTRIHKLLKKSYLAWGAAISVLFLVSYLFVSLFFSIQHTVSKLDQASQCMAGGDLSVRVNLATSDEMATVAESFNHMANSFGGIVLQIKQATEQIASAAEELSATSNQMTRGVGSQTEQIFQAAAAMEEMNATVVDVANNALQTAEAVSQAAETAEEGGVVVQRAIEGMNRISAKVHDAEKIIRTLGESSDKIGEIVGVIEEIADQTNLLALNAAIEAARAGEQGRGFSVVAEEVRKLAERTTKATSEIGEMISTIQRDTGGAVKAMEAGTQEVNQGMEEANQAGDALRKIVEMVKSANDMVHQIATAAEEQSTTAKEITENVEQVAGVSKDVSAGAQESTSAIEDLAQLASDLKEMAARFRLQGT